MRKQGSIKQITQKELARQLGLSRSTVAAALNPNSTVSLLPETRKRVLDTAQKLGYRPDPHAKAIRSGRSGFIGLLQFGGPTEIAAERASALTRSFADLGFHLLTLDANWFENGLLSACENLINLRVEGVILGGMNRNAHYLAIDRFHKAGIPMVAMSGHRLAAIPQVRIDAALAIRQLTGHLLKSGRKHLVLITFQPQKDSSQGYTWAAEERISGFTQGILQAGGELVSLTAPSLPDRIQGRVLTIPLTIQHQHSPDFGVYAARQLLKQKKLPDAVLCSNDEWALGMLAEFQQNNVSVPEQVAVTGFDGLNFGAYLTPSLTTVQQPLKEMAKAATSLLHQQIQNQPLPPDLLITVPGKILLRNSSRACL